jgi:hypothetical protein
LWRPERGGGGGFSGAGGGGARAVSERPAERAEAADNSAVLVCHDGKYLGVREKECTSYVEFRMDVPTEAALAAEVM